MTGLEGWKFDAKNPADRAVTAPRVVPDGRPATPNGAAGMLAGLISLALLGVVEGTLAWVALRWAADLGWLDQAPDWVPVVGMALAVTYLRGFDRAVFTRQ